MAETHLYQQIAEALRQQIMRGDLQPGDKLPSVREMHTRWNCTIGTVQHAYRELGRHGLITSRPGQGTRVASQLPIRSAEPLRRAVLVNKAEAFLLEMITTGYSHSEVQRAFQQAQERWQTVPRQAAAAGESSEKLRFAGSHDVAFGWLAAQYTLRWPGVEVEHNYCGSLGGLIALAAGEADVAGSHLWDEESDNYNIQFVRRLLPGRRVLLVTLAHRRLGLIVASGNPLAIAGLADLTRPGIRIVNRQPGSGTRVWLDATLSRLQIDPAGIQGYGREVLTHSEVARQIAEDKVDVGFGLEAAALDYGLDFIFLTRERYDLVIPAEKSEQETVVQFLAWLRKPEMIEGIKALGGYEVEDSGNIQWVEG
jgi:molybdate-binding protein/DNA-binding transcriptional regulator YhcF (GntR family)